VKQWLEGDPVMPPPPASRLHGRNSGWEQLAAYDVICMPDKWEYPWFASWDLAFHCIPLCLIDTDFAKRQLLLMTREWYMHPNGELPAYEWNFSDANPPVHAWASWRVFKIDAKMRGKEDYDFLRTIFRKLLLNFTWWVNRKDQEGRNIFHGGFLGLDNISIFDRSAKLPTGGSIYQSDATSWMAFYCMLMVKMSLELAKKDPTYQDLATKFFEHFLRITFAMIHCVEKKQSLWHEEDGFFYDLLSLPGGEIVPLKVRSLVGLIPLLAVETVEANHLDAMTVFRRRMKWFLAKYPEVRDTIACTLAPGECERKMIAILPKERLVRVLGYMLDEKEFLSEYGLRSMSKYYENNPYSLKVDGMDYSINYEPAESQTLLFGGNSNWRGPIWFPINFLIIEALQKYHHYYGDQLKVEFPTGSGNLLNLWDVAKELSMRLTRLFLKDGQGRRPIYRNQPFYHEDPHFDNLIQFNEYFHGDTGAGLGASHQTGWTGLVAKLIQQCRTDI
jgi:Mannosylglycerate hydrolase MGH1-like glycoside hydrolase domain/Glycosyl hydrolase family 63 C-terminal domain